MRTVSSRKKLFFDGDSKECGDCREIKPVMQFHRNKQKDSFGGSGQYHNRCKPCRNYYNYNLTKEKSLKTYPYLYWGCDSCDHLNHMRDLNCRKCGGKNGKSNADR